MSGQGLGPVFSREAQALVWRRPSSLLGNTQVLSSRGPHSKERNPDLKLRDLPVWEEARPLP